MSTSKMSSSSNSSISRLDISVPHPCCQTRHTASCRPVVYAIARQLEGLAAMQLQANGLPDAMDCRWRVPHIVRKLQCVAPGGRVSSVRRTISAISSSPIWRGAPGHGSSCRPARRSRANPATCRPCRGKPAADRRSRRCRHRPPRPERCGPAAPAPDLFCPDARAMPAPRPPRRSAQSSTLFPSASRPPRCSASTRNVSHHKRGPQKHADLDAALKHGFATATRIVL